MIFLRDIVIAMNKYKQRDAIHQIHIIDKKKMDIITL